MKRSLKIGLIEEEKKRMKQESRTTQIRPHENAQMKEKGSTNLTVIDATEKATTSSCMHTGRDNNMYLSLAKICT